jgi:hypothetical protein
MEWENILKDVVQDGTIRELYLKKVPVLKTCNNWRKVEPVGWIDYRMKLSYYKGGLVKLMGKLYFVPERTLDALSEYIEFKFKKHIQIIKD